MALQVISVICYLSEVWLIYLFTWWNVWFFEHCASWLCAIHIVSFIFPGLGMNWLHFRRLWVLVFTGDVVVASFSCSFVVW